MNKIVNKSGTFIKDNNSTFKIMRNYLIAFIPIILFSWYKNGYLLYLNNKTDIVGLFYPLLFIIMPAFFGFIIEFIYNLFTSKNINALIKTKESFSIFPGLIMALILPFNTPVFLILIGSIFASLSKILFGGFGKNKVNTSVIGAFIVVIIYTFFIGKITYLNGIETIDLINSTKYNIGSYDILVKPFGNLYNMFLGLIPGGIGTTSSFLSLLALIFLIFKKSIKTLIPIVSILSILGMFYLIAILNNLGFWYPLFQLFSSCVIFYIVFLLSDSVTSPVTRKAQVIYAIVFSLLFVIMRYFYNIEIGIIIIILLLNILSRLFDKLAFKFNKKIIYVLALILIVSTLIISTIFNKEKSFNLNSKDVTTYVVTQKSANDLIKATIKFEDGLIIKINLASKELNIAGMNEFIDNVIENQNNIDSVKPIDDNVFLSQAIKEMVLKTIELYEINLKEELRKFTVINKELLEFGAIYEVSLRGNNLKVKKEGYYTDIEVIASEIRIPRDTINKVIENQDDLDVVGDNTESFKLLKEILENINNLEENY